MLRNITNWSLNSVEYYEGSENPHLADRGASYVTHLVDATHEATGFSVRCQMCFVGCENGVPFDCTNAVERYTEMLERLREGLHSMIYQSEAHYRANKRDAGIVADGDSFERRRIARRITDGAEAFCAIAGLD